MKFLIFILGVGAAVVTAATLGIAFYIYIRRKKKNIQAVSSIPSQVISSCPSSDDPEKECNYFGLQFFTYSELEEATNNFDKARELGDGGFGTVYFGKT